VFFFVSKERNRAVDFIKEIDSNFGAIKIFFIKMSCDEYCFI